MWATRVSFPSPLFLSSPAIHGSHKSLKLRSSFYDFPLATKIVVRSLPYSIDESCLQEKFSKFGQIAEVKLAKDKSTERSKGYAFIQYTSQDDAMLALENMDQQIFDGRLIFVELAIMGKERFIVVIPNPLDLLWMHNPRNNQIWNKISGTRLNLF